MGGTRRSGCWWWTQERWCAVRAVRGKGSAPTGPRRVAAGVPRYLSSQDHGLQEPGLRVEGLDGLGSVRASLQIWPSIGPGQPTSAAGFLTPASCAQAFVPLTAAGECRSVAASLSTPCVAWSLENSGHEEKALLRPGIHNALVDDTKAEEIDSETCAFTSCLCFPRDIPTHEHAVLLSTSLAPSRPDIVIAMRPLDESKYVLRRP